MSEKERLMMLVEKAADAFDEGSDPFAPHWLVEHNVTLDECIAMGEIIAKSIRLAMAAIKR